MHFNIYLDDKVATKLDMLTKKLHKTRNALIREAIDLWLAQSGKLTWPEEILKFKGESRLPSFESYRHELKLPKEEVFP